MSTYAELKAQAEQLMRQAEELRKNERSGIIAEVKAKIAEYGISARELGLGSQKKASAGTGSSVAAKYRSPTGETWSGRGRQPTWLAQAIEAGKKKEEFLI